MDDEPGPLKRYGVSLACFLLVGGFLLHLYVALYTNATDTWSTSAGMAAPLLVVFAVLGFLQYFPLVLPMVLPLAAIAAALYSALGCTFGRRALRVDAGAACGILAGVATAAAHQAPELLHATAAWAMKWGIGAAMAGAAAGGSAAFILRRWRSAPRFATSTPGRLRVRAGVTAALAWSVAIAALGAAVNESGARTDEVLLRRDGERAASVFRASDTEERANVVAGMLASATHRSSIAESVPGSDYPQGRELRDPPAIARELARLDERLGPRLSTRMLATIQRDGSLSMLYVDRHASEEATETLVYRRRNGTVQLDLYNVIVQGPRNERRYASLLVSR